MSTAEALNNVVSVDYIKFDELIPGKKYKIHDFQTFHSTKFGKDRLCITLVLDDGYVILPERYDKLAAHLRHFNPANLYLIFNGRKNGKKLQLEFFEDLPLQQQNQPNSLQPNEESSPKHVQIENQIENSFSRNEESSPKDDQIENSLEPNEKVASQSD